MAWATHRGLPVCDNHWLEECPGRTGRHRARAVVWSDTAQGLLGSLRPENERRQADDIYSGGQSMRVSPKLSLWFSTFRLTCFYLCHIRSSLHHERRHQSRISIKVPTLHALVPIVRRETLSGGHAHNQLQIQQLTQITPGT